MGIFPHIFLNPFLGLLEPFNHLFRLVRMTEPVNIDIITAALATR
jgi:hypothetical protein